MSLLPGKRTIISGLLVTALFMFAYNRVPAVRKVLGGAA